MTTVYVVKQDNEYLYPGTDGDASWTTSLADASKHASELYEEAELLAQEHADPGHYQIIGVDR